jgi:hypothetical protein
MRTGLAYVLCLTQLDRLLRPVFVIPDRGLSHRAVARSSLYCHPTNHQSAPTIMSF